VATGSFPIFGNGRTLYHPLYIDNLVDAFLLAMDTAKGRGQTYLVADDSYVTIESLVRKVGDCLGVEVRTPHFPVLPLVVAGHVMEKVCRPFGIDPPIFPRRVDWYRQNRAFDIGKARRELGYQPQVNLEEGLRRTADWYRREGFLPG
jgi:nucleoside-diphosphate-sugar epimerase